MRKIHLSLQTGEAISPEHKSGNNRLSVFVADTWLSRLVGLLRFNKIDNYTALWLKPCASIHTMWMRFNIDVVFLDESCKVLKIKENVRPFSFVFAPKGTASVLEVAAFNAKQLGFSVNTPIKLQHY